MRKWLFFIFIFIVIGAIGLVLLFEQNERFRQSVYRTIIAENQIPEVYLPVYKEASEEYDIPWELLASVHRVETIFSTMDPLVSPVGALGHFQFMPRTWVGWTYPGTDEIGNIDDSVDITDTDLIAEHQGYGTDARDTGNADPFDMYDSAYSAARYLSDHGASEGNYEGALFSYNKSNDYVEEVMKYYNTYIEEFELIDLPFHEQASN